MSPVGRLAKTALDKARARMARFSRFGEQEYRRLPEERLEPGHPPAAAPTVSLRSISKSFGKVKANKDISLDIRPGRVLALLGENGAGKSTLMSILAGRFPPDSGVIEVDGEPTRFQSSREAIEAGVGMVYQHFMLVETMTVAQNVLLGQEGSFWVSPAEMERRVAALAKRYDLQVDPSALVSDLSMGEKQRVEILKLLYRNSRVLIFDEPTTVLTPPETEGLFKALRAMAAQGKAIVFISHKLQEVLDIADEIAVLRHGGIVDDMLREDVRSRSELASRMVGKEVVLDVDRAPQTLGGVVMELRDLSGDGLQNLNLVLRRGEIVAVVGVAGNGQKPLVEILAGLRQPRAGEVRILGRDWRDFHENPSWKDSLSYIPEDRLGMATCPELDMVDNMLLTTRQGFTKGPFLENKRALRTASELVRDYNVQPTRVRTEAAKLSGGNLQKLVLAREFYRSPKVIIAEQPTQGLDISATEEVWKRLLQARKHAGILLVTGDLGEALRLADRVAVMYRGRFMDVIPTADEERLEGVGLLMAGIKRDA